MFPGGMTPAEAQDTQNTGAGANGNIVTSAAGKREKAGTNRISYLCIMKGLKFR